MHAVHGRGADVLTHLLIAALGAFTGWHFVKGILPFRIPDRLALLVIAAIGYAILLIPDWRAQVALAGAAAVPLLREFMTDGGPGPWRVPRPRSIRLRAPSLRRRLPGTPLPMPEEATGQGFRPGGGPGRRIPTI